jgi:hypothetical protein
MDCIYAVFYIVWLPFGAVAGLIIAARGDAFGQKYKKYPKKYRCVVAGELPSRMNRFAYIS